MTISPQLIVFVNVRIFLKQIFLFINLCYVNIFNVIFALLHQYDLLQLIIFINLVSIVCCTLSKYDTFIYEYFSDVLYFHTDNVEKHSLSLRANSDKVFVIEWII